MLILLPPSETKVPGGGAVSLDVGSLSLPELAPQRDAVIDALVALSADPERAAKVLKLGARNLGDIAHNAALRTAPTMPAIDRYTGVLFDALGAGNLDAAARRWLGRHVLIHSAPFGPVGALDGIPNYRLQAGTALPGVPPLRRWWADAVGGTLARVSASVVLDLRSEAYVSLGPAPEGSLYVRVVTEGEDGTVRALNHFNKKAKGELVRSLAISRPRFGTRRGLLKWARESGWVLRETTDAGVVELAV